MACRKLTYQNLETPLKVVYRKPIENEKGVQRFMSVDPLQFDYPYYTPYQYAGNKPISYIDLDGLEEVKTDDLPEAAENKLHKNVIIIIDTKDVIEKSEMNSVKPENWHVIYATNIVQAENKLSSNDKIGQNSIENLIVRSHGRSDYGGTLSIASDGYVRGADMKEYGRLLDKGKLSEYWGYAETSLSDLNSFNQLGNYIKDGGNIVFTACFTERGSLGENIREISTFDHVNIYTNLGKGATLNRETKALHFNNNYLQSNKGISGFMKYSKGSNVGLRLKDNGGAGLGNILFQDSKDNPLDFDPPKAPVKSKEEVITP